MINKTIFYNILLIRIKISYLKASIKKLALTILIAKRKLLLGGVIIFSPLSSVYGNTFMQMCESPTPSQRVTLQAIADAQSGGRDNVKINCQRLEEFNVKRGYGYSLRLGNSSITDLTPLRFFPDLEELTLSENNITDLTPLSQLYNLTHLNISGNPIDDISPISGLTNLKNLKLYRIQGGVKNLKSIKNLTNLKILFIGKGFENLEALSSLKKLQYLAVLYNPIISDICTIKNLTLLERLVLHGTAVTDINCLNGLKNITKLSLLKTPVKDLSVISNYESLAYLDISETLVENIPNLKKLTNLKRLYINNTKITDISGLHNPKMRMFSSRKTSLRWCSPKSISDIQKGVSCYEKTGELKSWWKRLLRM